MKTLSYAATIDMACCCSIFVSRNNGSFHGTHLQNENSFPGTIYKNKEKKQWSFCRGVVTKDSNRRIWDKYKKVISLFGCIIVSDVFLLMKATIVNRILRFAQAFKGLTSDS